MKNKRCRTRNTSSNFHKSSDTSFSLNSEEDFFNEEKFDFPSKTDSKGYIHKQKTRQPNSLDELTKKFLKCAVESNSPTINLNSIMKKIKVKKRRIYDITNVLEGIGFLKKETKNQVKLQKEFYDIYWSQINNNKFVIDINEDNFSDDKNYLNIESLDEEINYINYLIKITEEKLLSFENGGNNINNNENKLTLTNKDILEINDHINNNGKTGLLSVKSEDKFNVEIIQSNDTKPNKKQKKSEINCGKAQGNEDYINLASYPNQLCITSKNNKPIYLKEIAPSQEKSKEVEKIKVGLNNFKNISDKENIINNNDLINNENTNENKNELINFNLMKNFYAENKIRKDSLISDYSCNGNFINNVFAEQTAFNNMNNFNYYNMCLNKNENEVF